MEIVTDEINVTKSKEVNSTSNERLDTLSKTDEKKETDNVLSSFEEALVDDVLNAVKNELSHDRDKKFENKQETDLNTKIAVANSAKTTSTKDDDVIESGETTQERQTNNGIETTGQKKPLLKRKKRTKCWPFKRRRLALTKYNETKKVNGEIVSSAELAVDTLSGDVEYYLTVSNLPHSWSFMDIKNYVDLQCGPVDEIEMIKDDDTGIGAIRLSYQVMEECETAMAKLAGKEIEGNKLTVSMSVVVLSDCEMPPETPPGVESNPETTNNPEKVTQQCVTTQPSVPELETANKEQKPPAITKPWRPDLDMWEIDPKGTYGLKESFLKSVGITPPLDKWVHVSNFRSDKADLRDALEMAGRVVICAVFHSTPKYANVMYSHPLEAVQAVTLLNGQNMYGLPLKVVMERSPVDSVLLPKGLKTTGPGLGANNKPQRNLIEHYQRYVTNKPSSLNLVAFDEVAKNNHLIIGDSVQVKRIEDFNYVVPKSEVKKTLETKPDVDPPGTKSPEPKPIPVTSKPAAKLPARSPVRAQGPQNFGPSNGPNFGQFGPRPMWNGPGPGHGPRPIWNGPGPMRPPGPMGGPMHGPRPMGPMGGPMQGPMPGPMPGPMQGHMQGPISGPMQGPMQVPMQGNMQGPMQVPMQGPTMTPMQNPVGQMFDPNQPVQLQLSNLPPSTTFAILCEKMASCGQVVSLQLTTPGAAVVTFANKMQADYCYTSYNNMWIEGYYIQVNYGS